MTMMSSAPKAKQVLEFQQKATSEKPMFYIDFAGDAPLSWLSCSKKTTLLVAICIYYCNL